MGWPGKQEAEIDGRSVDVHAARSVFAAGGSNGKGRKRGFKGGSRPKAATSEKQRRSEAAALARAEAMHREREAGGGMMPSQGRHHDSAPHSRTGRPPHPSTAAASAAAPSSCSSSLQDSPWGATRSAADACVGLDPTSSTQIYGRVARREWFEGHHARLDTAGHVAGLSAARPGVLERTRAAVESLKAVAETGQPLVSMADRAMSEAHHGGAESESARMASMTPLERATRRVERMLLEQGVVRASVGGLAPAADERGIRGHGQDERAVALSGGRGSVARARAAFEKGPKEEEKQRQQQKPGRRLRRAAEESQTQGPYVQSFLPPKQDALSDAAIDVEYMYVDAARFVACNEGGRPTAAAASTLRKAASERVARGEWGTKEGHASIVSLLSSKSTAESVGQVPLGARIDALRVDVEMATAAGAPSPRDGLYATLRELSARASQLRQESIMSGSSEDTAVASACVADLAKFSVSVASLEASFCRQHLRAAFCLVEVAGRTRHDPSAGTTPFVSLVLGVRASTLMTRGGASASAAAAALAQEIRADPAALARDVADLRKRCVTEVTENQRDAVLRLLLLACKSPMCDVHANDARAMRMDLLDRRCKEAPMRVTSQACCSLQCRLQHEARSHFAGLLSMGDVLQLVADMLCKKGHSIKDRLMRRYSQASHDYAAAVAGVTGEKASDVDPGKALLDVYARVMTQGDVAGGRLELNAAAAVLSRPIRVCHFAAGDPEAMRALGSVSAAVAPEGSGVAACPPVRRYLASADGILDDEMPPSSTDEKQREADAALQDEGHRLAASAPEPRPRIQGRLVCEMYGWHHAGEPLEVFHEACGHREHVMLPIQGSVVPGRGVRAPHASPRGSPSSSTDDR